jgi:hypothetical protein
MVAGDRGNGDAHRLLFDLANRGYQLSPCRIARGAGGLRTVIFAAVSPLRPQVGASNPMRRRANDEWQAMDFGGGNGRTFFR